MQSSNIRHSTIRVVQIKSIPNTIFEFGSLGIVDFNWNTCRKNVLVNKGFPSLFFHLYRIKSPQFVKSQKISQTKSVCVCLLSSKKFSKTWWCCGVWFVVIFWRIVALVCMSNGEIYSFTDNRELKRRHKEQVPIENRRTTENSNQIWRVTSKCLLFNPIKKFRCRK